MGKLAKQFIEGKFIQRSMRIIDRWIVDLDKRIGNFSRNILLKNEPIKHNKIMFITFQGDYTCNPRYICDELLKRNKDYDIVWSLRRKSYNSANTIPEGVRVVEQYTEEYFRELASAKIWIANSVEFQKRLLKKKKDQVFIETWHGSLGIKRFDAAVNSGKAWVKAAFYCGDITDYVLSNSNFEDSVYRESFWQKAKIVKAGHARNDMLISADKCKISEIKKSICKKYSISEKCQLVLYAPTFRDSHRFNNYRLCPDEIISALHNRFGGEWKMLVRYHPTMRKYSSSYFKSENVIDVTSWVDIQELILISQVAITDYSSWIFDFVLTRRPGFLYVPDRNQYENERGFYYPLEDTPFPIANSNESLVSQIEAFNSEKYLEKIESFFSRLGVCETGHAAEAACDLIESLITEQSLSGKIF